jgi:zinc protease
MTTERSSLPGPHDIFRGELSNGIVVLVRSHFHSPSVFLSGYFNGGSLFDPDEKLGLADFTSTALMRGTQDRGFQQIYDTLESAGASFGYNSGTRTVGLNGKSLAEDLPMLLGIFAGTLRRPSFPAEQVEKLRAQLLTGLSIRAQDTASMASMAFDQILFEGHPYARPDDGWPETIQAIDVDDLVAFHKHIYGPRGMVLAIVGAVEPQEALSRVEEALGDWHNPDQPEVPNLPPLRKIDETVRCHHAIPGKSQSDLVIGVAGPERRAEDYMAASLGNSILGQFGLMGRIGDSVRERSGLAYYAYSSLNAGIGPGIWEVSAGVNPGNLQKAADLIVDELRSFTEQGVSAEELADNQANYIGRLPLSMESNSGVAGALLNIERYDLGLDYYQRYPSIVNAVTPEAVRDTARKYIDPGRLVIASAGPE